MIGLLIYTKDDYEKNKSYGKWFIEEFSKYNIELKLVIKEDIKSLSNIDNIAFVINRSRDYHLSLKFELNNIKVYNTSFLTLLGNDKISCYKYIDSLDIKYPKLHLLPKNLLISKPNNGHGGLGVHICNNDEYDSMCIYQDYIENTIGDVRFYIINNKIEHAVLRKKGDDLRANYSLGCDFELYNYTNSDKKLVKKILQNLKIDYCGIDFLLTSKEELLFNEIEDVVGSRMLSELGINNTVPCFTYNIVKELGVI